MRLIDNILFIPYKIYNQILIHLKNVDIGENVRIEGGISHYGKDKSFVIGNNVRIISCQKKILWGGHEPFSLQVQMQK